MTTDKKENTDELVRIRCRNIILLYYYHHKYYISYRFSKLLNRMVDDKENYMII